jgi:cell fate regulator YaaT (PSP1 superfamily)
LDTSLWLTGSYERILQEKEKADFEQQQQIALKIFPTFKKEFQAEYPNSVPITARFQIFSNQLYFFFYSEERYIFTEFVKRFREKLGMNMFLFQIGARDMMRMSPGADGMYGPCGNQLCCKSNMVLPNIEIETVIIQNLEGRDIERLKGKC